MKSFTVFFEHCCSLTFFFKRFISASWLQTIMELQKKIFCKKHLEWQTKTNLAWDSRFCYGYSINI
jgi:hypothetical protein